MSYVNHVRFGVRVHLRSVGAGGTSQDGRPLQYTLGSLSPATKGWRNLLASAPPCLSRLGCLSPRSAVASSGSLSGAVALCWQSCFGCFITSFLSFPLSLFFSCRSFPLLISFLFFPICLAFPFVSIYIYISIFPSFPSLPFSFHNSLPSPPLLSSLLHPAHLLTSLQSCYKNSVQYNVEMWKRGVIYT